MGRSIISVARQRSKRYGVLCSLDGRHNPRHHMENFSWHILASSRFVSSHWMAFRRIAVVLS